MSELLGGLLEANLAAAAAIVTVLLIRGSVRRIAGAHAAYLLWAIVPAAVFATLIPARTGAVQVVTLPASVEPAAIEPVVVKSVVEPLPGVAMPVVRESSWVSVDWTGMAVAALPWLWLGGLALMLAWIASRQAMFMADVKRGLAGPAVVGFAKPRVVTPADFTERFSPEEQALILAHEQVHLRRGDARLNAVVALARCVCWFNPLAHIGARAMRIDQELSCDASVIEARPSLKRAYAETLVKTQLASRPLPMGAYWPPEHPLMRRVEMLGRAGTVSRVRRMAGAGIVVTMLLGGSLAAWGLQPERPGPIVIQHETDAEKQAQAWLQDRVKQLREAGRPVLPTFEQQRVEVEARLREAERFEKKLASIPPLNVQPAPAPQEKPGGQKFDSADAREAVDGYKRAMELMSGRMPRASDTLDLYREFMSDRRLDAGRAVDMIDGFGAEVKRYLETHREDRLMPDGVLLQPGETSAYAALKAELSRYEEALAEIPLTNGQSTLQDELQRLQNGPVPTPEEAVRMEADNKAQKLAKGYDRGRAVTINGVLKGVKITPEARELRVADVATGQIWIADGPLVPGGAASRASLQTRWSAYVDTYVRIEGTQSNDGACAPECRMYHGRIAFTGEAAPTAPPAVKGYERGRAVTVQAVLKSVKIMPQGRELRFVDVGSGQTWIADGPVVEGGAQARAALEKDWGAHVDEYVWVEGWQSNDGLCAPECRMYHGRIKFWNEKALPAPSAQPRL